MPAAVCQFPEGVALSCLIYTLCQWRRTSFVREIIERMHPSIRRAMFHANVLYPDREEEIRTFVNGLMADPDSPGDPAEIAMEIRKRFPEPEAPKRRRSSPPRSSRR
jgi:hypothetical protein